MINYQYGMVEPGIQQPSASLPARMNLSGWRRTLVLWNISQLINAWQDSIIQSCYANASENY